MLDFVHIIILLPVFVSFFWGIYFMISAVLEKTPKRHLLFFFLSTFLSFMAGVAFFFKNYTFYQASYVPVVFFALSQFPALYIYIHSLTNQNVFSKRIYFHYLYPFIAMLSAVVIHGFYMTGQENYIFVSEYLATDKILKPPYKIAFIIDKCYKMSFIALAIFYYIKVNKRVKEHRKKIQDYFSSLDLVNLKWIDILNILFFLTLLSGIFFHSLERSLFIQYPVLLIFPHLSLAVFLWFVGYFGSQQATIFKPNTIIEQEKPIKEQDSLRKELLDLMEKEKPFLKPDITLPDLALYLNTNRTYLSKILNEHIELNFNQFINNYRLEYSLKYLNDYDDMSILNIADLCGFNSYDTFNRCFKKKYNMSPKQFREQAQIS